MNKVYKKLNKQIKIDSWKESNRVFAKILSKYILDNKLGNSIINIEVDNDGFFIEFEVTKNISEKSLPLIEGKIRKLFFNNQKSNSNSPISMIRYFKLRGVSGLTLNNKNGNRIFGFATISKNEFDIKLKEIQEKEQRDHRKIGKNLDLFYFDDLAGKGMPIWLPNGFWLKKQIKNYIYKQEEKYGSQIVETPVIGSVKLYEISGHLSHYKNTMFPIMKNNEKEEFVLRPMSCPHHILIYKSKLRSYKDLPFRIAEDVKMFRYEHSGALIGLERVRGMELTDSHIFLREDQLKEELKKSINLIKETLLNFNIKIKYIELSLHDSNDKDKYHGDNNLWMKGESILREYLIENKIKYIEKKGEAAFYGPKIDIQIKTALGHIITISTIQLDFFLSKQFKLEYIDSNNEKKTPIIIHRGHIGTYERFISVLLEQTKGDLPMWLSPQQAVIIPINNKFHFDYSNNIYNILFNSGIRVQLDSSNERLSNKIRKYQKQKVKTQIIIGDEEIKNNIVSYRFYGSEKIHKIKLENIIEIYNN